MHKVFVYGTLRVDESNNYLLDQSTYFGAACTAPAYTMWLPCHAYPAVFSSSIFRQGNTRIAGDLYLCDADTLDALDQLEGHPHFFRRRKTCVFDDYNNPHIAWMYFLAPRSNQEFTTISSGDWKAYQCSRPS